MKGYHRYRLPPSPDEPTPRQIQVMQAICDGHYTCEAVAAHLGTSPRTISTHLTALYERLDVDSKEKALLLMWQRGYVTIEGAE